MRRATVVGWAKLANVLAFGGFVTRVGVMGVFLLVSLVSPLGGCSKDETPAPPPPTSRDYARAVEHARSALAATVDHSSVTRLEKYDALTASLANARKNDTVVDTTDISERMATIDAAISDLSDVEGQLAALEEPVEPEKPIWEKPDYGGVFHISGAYRGPYDQGGVVVQTKGAYYVIQDANEPDGYTTSLNGYVEDTGDIVTLNIGRDGRDAHVVNLSDKETFRDDQATYKEEVRDAKAEYEAAKKAYPRDLATFKMTKIEYGEKLQGLTARKTDITSKRDQLLAELAGALSTAAPVGSTPPEDHAQR